MTRAVSARAQAWLNHGEKPTFKQCSKACVFVKTRRLRLSDSPFMDWLVTTIPVISYNYNPQNGLGYFPVYWWPKNPQTNQSSLKFINHIPHVWCLNPKPPQSQFAWQNSIQPSSNDLKSNKTSFCNHGLRSLPGIFFPHFPMKFSPSLRGQPLAPGLKWWGPNGAGAPGRPEMRRSCTSDGAIFSRIKDREKNFR